MKLTIANSLVQFMLMPAAYASLDPMAFCETAMVKAQMNATDTCQVVAAIRPKKQMYGNCTATFMKQLACKTTFVSSTQGSLLNLTCGDPKAPAVATTMQAEVTEYNVAALIRQEDGNEFLINDPKDYTHFNSSILELNLDSEAGVSTPSMVFITQGKKVPFENLKCEM